MTARLVAAMVLLLLAAGLLWVAALTPLRADEIAAFDAEAQRLGEEWRDATSLEGGNEADRLLRASNDAFIAARDLEPPLGPVRAVGFALLAIAGGVALWPGRPTAADAVPER